MTVGDPGLAFSLLNSEFETSSTDLYTSTVVIIYSLTLSAHCWVQLSKCLCHSPRSRTSLVQARPAPLAVSSAHLAAGCRTLLYLVLGSHSSINIPPVTWCPWQVPNSILVLFLEQMCTFNHSNV